ncbi:hypothetical protein B296_00057891 [Ensete ventricosum]|uniref:Uncharacterized protein n=1 Tax=Ensete ventricosum TaxID=4639 RepID=A0A426X9S7_ENSVE|nr:hypothetical protein B296_00057891 [Ensete ventricosum]
MISSNLESVTVPGNPTGAAIVVLPSILTCRLPFCLSVYLRQERFIRRWAEALGHPKVSYELRSIWISYLSQRVRRHLCLCGEWLQCDTTLGQKVANHLNMRPNM